LPERQKGETAQYDRGLTRRDGEIGRLVRRRLAVTMAVAVRTTGAAGLGAGTERLINDGFDGARASATFGAATEATINLLGMARKIFSGPDGVADIVVAEDVAGTNDHEGGALIGGDAVEPTRY
jgi:hypothetical protein